MGKLANLVPDTAHVRGAAYVDARGTEWIALGICTTPAPKLAAFSLPRSDE